MIALWAALSIGKKTKRLLKKSVKMKFIEKRVNKRACSIRVSNIPNLALTACTLPFLNHQDSLELRCITRNSSKVKLALVQ